MAAKMTVLRLTQTGHVLAAMAEPDAGPPPLAALVGDAFPLGTTRDKQAGGAMAGSFRLPAATMELKSLAYDSRVIARPQSFAVNGSLVAELPAGTAPTVTLAAGKVGLTNGSGNVAADTKVLVVAQSEDDADIQRIQAGVVLAPTPSVNLNPTIVPGGPAAALPAGNYLLAIAFEGQPLAYLTATV